MINDSLQTDEGHPARNTDLLHVPHDACIATKHRVLDGRPVTVIWLPRCRRDLHRRSFHLPVLSQTIAAIVQTRFHPALVRLTPVLRVLSAALLLFPLFGCGTVVQRDPVPEHDIDHAQLPGFPAEVRFWGDVVPPNARELIRQSLDKQKAAGLLYDASGSLSTSYSLALSGGGAEGAFGAGLLKGWSAAGYPADV